MQQRVGIAEQRVGIIRANGIDSTERAVARICAESDSGRMWAAVSWIFALGRQADTTAG